MTDAEFLKSMADGYLSAKVSYQWEKESNAETASRLTAIAGRIEKTTAPLECRVCKSASGPEWPLDGDCPGWLCPPCYAESRVKEASREAFMSGFMEGNGFEALTEPDLSTTAERCWALSDFASDTRKGNGNA